MRKINLFLLFLVFVTSFNLHARRVVVGTAASFKTAFNGALDKDTILLNPGTYSMSNGLVIPTNGLFVVQSAYKDSMAIIQMQLLSNTADSINKRSLIFKNLHIQGRYGNYTTNSSYIIDLNNRIVHFDTLAFRNCEISMNSRCIIRSGRDDRRSSGDLDWFELSNCYLHHMNSAGNVWSLFYIGHTPVTMNLKNNTFCDMPYCKSIVEFRPMPITGRNAEINFINNTVVNTWASSQGILYSNNYLGEEAAFNIKNNVFLLPNWSDDTNMSRDSITKYKIPPIIRCVRGMISASNNLVDSMAPWINGQIIDIDGEGGFIAIDTLNTYRMKDLNVSWIDFADPKGNDFSYLSTNLLATSGTTNSPIGDPRWVKHLVAPAILSTSANIVKAVVTPANAFYESGAQVTVKASVVDGYAFVGWKKVSDGTLLSTDYTYTFHITSDTKLLAEYKELIPRTISITISGSKSASYTIVPIKSIYFEGDVITVSLNTHGINNFIGWSDGKNDLTRSITLTNDLSLTASFSEHPYIVAWDFSQLTANNQTFTRLAPNFAMQTINTGYMNYVMTDTIRTISTRNSKWVGVGLRQINCLVRRTTIANFGNPDYPYIKISTKGLTNLKVKSDYGTDNSLFTIQKMQYSVDGKTYTDFALDTVSGEINQTWRHFEGVLPTAAENQDSISVRWIADTSTKRLFVTGLDETTAPMEYFYLGNIIVINSSFVSAKTLLASDSYHVYSSPNKLFVQAEVEGKAEVVTLVGVKVMEKSLNLGLNEFSGLNSGIYIVRIGSIVHKVLIK